MAGEHRYCRAPKEQGYSLLDDDRNSQANKLSPDVALESSNWTPKGKPRAEENLSGKPDRVISILIYSVFFCALGYNNIEPRKIIQDRVFKI
mgnify:CR=1 FL=1